VLGPSPYTLAAPAFPLRALALATGRAALGGPRESLLAAYTAGRLVLSLTRGLTMTAGERKAQADAARTWAGTIAIPATAKAALNRVVDAVGAGDRKAAGVALAKVTEVTAQALDNASRLELESVAASVAGP